jgi:hypothetical protein
VPASLDEWSDQHWDRTFLRQSAQVDSAKLLVTFALAFSGTLVATALQVAPQGRLDLAASLVVGVGFLLTVTVILLDRLKWPSRRKMLDRQADLGWTDAQLLAYIRSATRDVEEENEATVGRVHCFARYQLLVSGAAAVLAVISLFQPTSVG